MKNCSVFRKTFYYGMFDLFDDVHFPIMWCAHFYLFIRTRSLVERCATRVTWVPCSSPATGCVHRWALYSNLPAKCLCAGELALKWDAYLPLQSCDQSVLCRGQYRCPKVQIKKNHWLALLFVYDAVMYS